MSTPETRLGILFADIVSSTALYEQLGDVKAEELISKTLQVLAKICTRHKGLVVKTIGDEVMCRFDQATHMLDAAIEMQNTLHRVKKAGSSVQGIRIGAHFGEALIRGKDIFGDSVNIAARLAAFARNGQIICSEDSWLESQQASVLSTAINSRALAAIDLKGKQGKVKIREVLWQAEDMELTRLVTQPSAADGNKGWSLELSYFGVSVILNGDKNDITLGRSDACGLPVAVPTASRIHAKIGADAQQATLSDQSTNGTYVKPDGLNELLVHRQTIPLTGSGCISLGSPSANGGEHLIRYTFRQL